LSTGEIASGGEGSLWGVKVHKKHQFLGFLALIFNGTAVSFPGSIYFLRLPRLTLLLILGGVCLAFGGVVLLVPAGASVGRLSFLLFLSAGY